MKTNLNILKRYIKDKNKILSCKYNNLEYDFEVPTTSEITFKNILDDFGNKYFDQEKSHKDFEICKKEVLNNNDNVLDYDLESPFTIYDFELNKNNLFKKTGENYLKVLEFPELYLYDFYNPRLLDRILPNVSTFILKDMKKKVYNDECNFFDFLLKRYPDLCIPSECVSKFNKINLNFKLEEQMHKDLKRINIKDKNNHKQLLIQLIYPFIEFKQLKQQEFIIDIDYILSGIDTREYEADMVLMNKKDHIYLPISIIDKYDIQDLDKFIKYDSKDISCKINLN